MMRGVTLIFVSWVTAHVALCDINVVCREYDDFPPIKHPSPSVLAGLNVKLVTVGTQCKLNISWAINIDGSIRNLEGTRIVVSGESIHCIYKPPGALANHNGSVKWFHYLAPASYGSNTIQASNLPLPKLGSGSSYTTTSIMVHQQQIQRVTPTTTQVPLVEHTSTAGVLKDSGVPGETNFTNMVVLAIFGGLANLILLSSCFMIYKNCRANLVSTLGFKMLPTSPMVPAPVPVLMVYPAENSAFQQAVMALAEFLEWHGGCSVAVDMWQQGKIAELGPMRWLAEQTKAADRVLIVCPQPFSQPSESPPSHDLREPSIPAAAHDLYPLILNMVAGHAKSVSDLSKFWVVQLGKQQVKRPNNLVLELRACKTFCLMKDLIKLCRSLHTQRQDTKEKSNLIFGPGTKNSTVKLREAVEKLGSDHPGIVRELEPLKSVVTII